MGHLYAIKPTHKGIFLNTVWGWISKSEIRCFFLVGVTNSRHKYMLSCWLRTEKIVCCLKSYNKLHLLFSGWLVKSQHNNAKPGNKFNSAIQQTNLYSQQEHTYCIVIIICSVIWHTAILNYDDFFLYLYDLFKILTLEDLFFHIKEMAQKVGLLKVFTTTSQTDHIAASWYTQQRQLHVYLEHCMITC